MSNSRFSLLVTANGRVEIDQNLCENAMRRLALGRNYDKLGIMRSSAFEGHDFD